MGYKVKRILVGDKQVRPYKWSPGSNTVAYYPFTSSSTTSDISGNNYNLTNVGNSITFGTNQGVDCASFDGNQSHYLEATISTLPTGNSVRTLSVWTYLNRTGPTSSHQDCILFYGAGSSGNLWFEGVGGTNDGSSFSGKYIISTYAAGGAGGDARWKQWANIIVTYDQSNIVFYVNGVGTTMAATNQNTSNNILRIGGGTTWAGGTRDWLGYMSNLIIENRVWSASEVSDYYNKTKSNYGL